MILLALFLTLLIEAVVLLALRERSLIFHCFLVALNIFTNLTANLFLRIIQPQGNAYIIFVACAETLILIVEACLICLFTRSIRKGVLYSVCCNTISYVVGAFILHFI